MWVLLDGGPSRAFSDSDITMMEDDLNVLKVSLSPFSDMFIHYEFYLWQSFGCLKNHFHFT